MQEIVVITESVGDRFVGREVLNEIVGLLIQPATVLREIKEN